MYLEKIIFDNRAPFEHIEIDFKSNGVNVLTAINGKGKTSILSHITDALYELAKPAFPQEFEGKENKLYRISSPLYNMISSKPSIVYIRFKEGDITYDYINYIKSMPKEYYNDIMLSYGIDVHPAIYTKFEALNEGDAYSNYISLNAITETYTAMLELREMIVRRCGGAKFWE